MTEISLPLGSVEQLTQEAKCVVKQLSLTHQVGFDFQKRRNFSIIGQDKLVGVCGSLVVFIDLETNKITYHHGLDSGGVGSVAVHPSQTKLAVAGKSLYGQPCIYIYSYPEMELQITLRNGTEQAYSQVVFSHNGEQLASVGSAPDYMLTVWDWQNEQVVLRAKAFSQEIYNVKFSPYLPGHLATSGTGHIRFWKMANTFTGLKLQGQIGKFGAIELSDVFDFVEFQDGKYLSTSEQGNLIVWDGGQIKVVLTLPNELPCHVGGIEFLMKAEGSDQIISGGKDGYIKFWDVFKLNEVEADEDSLFASIEPIQQVHIGQDILIQKVLCQDINKWVVVDGNGKIHKVELQESGLVITKSSSSQIFEYHAGGIVGLGLSNSSPVVYSAGTDGTVRALDYTTKQLLGKHQVDDPCSTMTMMPDVLDIKQNIVAVGYQSGAFRIIQRHLDGFKLIYASKPHTEKITQIEFSPNGKYICTISSDKTAFFFAIQSVDAIDPIAFTTLQSTPLSLCWHTEKRRVLIGLENSTVVEIQPPQLCESALSSFQRDMECRVFVFKKPRPETKQSSEEQSQAQENEDKTNELEPVDSMALTHGRSNAQGQEEEEEEEEEDETAYGVTFVRYHEECTDTFMLTANQGASGQIFICQFDGSQDIIGHQLIDQQISFVNVMKQQNIVAIGGSKGQVRVGPISCLTSGCQTNDAWYYSQLHDCQSGVISGIVSSQDGCNIISSARDGTLFVQTNPDVEDSTLQQSAVPEQLLPMHKDPLQVAQDVTRETYSIEQHKLKSEQENLLAAAEAKKEGLRQEIAQIREDFKALVEYNDSLPAAQRLPKEMFEIDANLRDMIKQERQQREEQVRKELEFDIQKKKLAVKKLQSWFLDDVEVEHITLHSFRGGYIVCSFRLQKIPQNKLKEMQKIKYNHDLRLSQKLENKNEPQKFRDMGIGMSSRNPFQDIEQINNDHRRSQVANQNATMSKIDARKAARQQRKQEWEKFNASKPDQNYENPEDVKAIQQASSMLGDYKLKSDPNYVAPEDERINVAKKRQQILLFDYAVHQLKQEFNKQFFAMREIKRKVIQQICEKNCTMRQINNELQRSETVTDPKMLLEEQPELRYEITEEEINNHLAAKKAQAQKASGGFGMTGSGKQAEDASVNRSGGNQGDQDQIQKQKAMANETTQSALLSIGLSDLEKAERDYREKILRMQYDNLIKEVRDMEEAFDEGLKNLLQEKLRLECDLKFADVRRVVLLQELMLLRDFENKETTLENKKQTKLNDQSEVSRKIQDLNEKLENKKAELEQIIQKKQNLISLFDQLVEESHPYRDPLYNTYIRKIKRNKKLAISGEETESDEDNDDDMDDNDDDYDDLDGNGEDEDVCPPGCDKGIYDKVCQLREKRQDLEEELSEYQAGLDMLSKEKEPNAKKLKLIAQSLEAIQEEIIEFQKEKQQKMNEIIMPVILYMHQIEYLVDGKLPVDMSQAVVFRNQDLHRLKQRIKELDDEKVEFKKRQRDLRREHEQVARDKHYKESRLRELQSRAIDVQILKFGQVIDLELLDQLGPSKGAEDLREQIKKQDMAFINELKEYDNKISNRRQELAMLTKENTEALHQVAKLAQSQQNLEQTLSSTRNSLAKDPVTEMRQEVAERDALVQLVNTQAKEIEFLQQQINLLRRKDTSLYS